jgi:hypothetical protein
MPRLAALSHYGSCEKPLIQRSRMKRMVRRKFRESGSLRHFANYKV